MNGRTSHGAAVDEPALPQLTILDGIATIRLNRPDHGNALDMASARAFRDAVDSLRGQPDLRAVVLRATGRVFCAGGDVREMAAVVDRASFLRDLAGTMHHALLGLRAMPVPIIAAVQGTAAGAGIGLVLAADIVIASDDARFLAAYGGVGLTPDCGVSALLPATVGPRRAALLALTDAVLDASTALDWGLITECCAPDEVEPRLSEILARITSRPAAARGATAMLLRRGLEAEYATQLNAEAHSIARLSHSPEAGRLIDAIGRPERRDLQ